jgi:nitroimidazol reductase NimA-like FMN-containing flavoprotein (pyridoxamine 5'-phosphate oxidase superfamily)
MKDLEQEVRKILRKNMWCVLSTVGDKDQPHSSVIAYQSDGYALYFMTGPDALKTRDINKNEKVAITIPFRKGFFHKLIPAPPAELHFQARAVSVSKDDETARQILARFIKISEKADVEEDSVWYKLIPSNIISTFGVGIRLLSMRNPEKARNMVHLKPSE